MENVIFYVKACAELTAYTLILAGAFAGIEYLVDRARGRRPGTNGA
jgi:hypothetical protein